MTEPTHDLESLPDLRTAIETMRPTPARFMELRGTALQLLDDLDAAYRRITVAYERLDLALIPREDTP